MHITNDFRQRPKLIRINIRRPTPKHASQMQNIYFSGICTMVIYLHAECSTLILTKYQYCH